MHKSILFLALILCVFTSCFKERIELDNNTDENKKIVISAWITPLDESQFITISQTVNYLGSFVQDMVSDAEVSLKDESMTYTLTEQEAGTYYLPEDWTPQIGNSYELKVLYDGKEYTASHVMRPCPEIEDLDFDFAETIDNVDFYETVFGFQEIPGEGDAYFGVAYPKGTDYKDTITYGGYANDAFLDGQYIGEVYLSNGELYFEEGDTAVVDLFSIGLETSNYLQDIETEIFRGSPFDPPPANVRTNFSGGAVGYFIISDARRAEIVIE